MEPIPYDSIIKQFPYGLCIVDGKGITLRTNPALEALFGRHVVEWHGLPLALCLEQAIPDPAHALSWTAALNQALALGETTHLTLPTDFRTGPDCGAPVNGTPDAGGLVPVTGLVAPWHRDGEISGAFAVFRDGSLQKDLQGAQARFLAVLSHELGAPVVNLGAAADLLANRLHDGDQAQQRLITLIRSEASHLRRILAQLPSTLPARIETPQAREDVVTLRPVLRRVAQAFGVRDLDCQIVVDVPPDLPFAWCDAEQVQGILGKLVENAICYAPHGGQIVLAAEGQDGEVLVSVKTRGPDGSPEGEKKISARFSFALPCVQDIPDEEVQTE